MKWVELIRVGGFILFLIGSGGYGGRLGILKTMCHFLKLQAKNEFLIY